MSRIKNRRYDYILPTILRQEYTSWAIGRQVGVNIANTNPWVSPISNGVSFEGFPKTFITAGELEVLRDGVAVLKEAMGRDIGEDNVEYYLAPLAATTLSC